MTTQRLRPILVNSLLDTLFSGAAYELRDCCARWCASSPRFATFLETHGDKIQKKLRGVDGAKLGDLRAELRTAACLLSERVFTLEYEKYAASKTRGPDFSLLFKTHTPFNVEVKRIRGRTQPEKWADVLCDKLGQLPPSVINVLVIYSESSGQEAAPFDVGAAMAHLHTSAERKDEVFFTRRGLRGARDYLRQSSKLSAVVFRAGAASDSAAPLASWINPRARHPLSPELRSALLRSLEAL